MTSSSIAPGALPVPQRRYRVPTASAYAEVSLDEFSIDEILEYLRHRGEEISDPSEGCWLASDDLAHIETLAMCGLHDAAREEALRLVGEAIGRRL